MQRVFLHRSAYILLGLLMLCATLGFGSLTHEAQAAPSQVSITQFQTQPGDSLLEGITSGPDGNLWFTEGLDVPDSKIGVITPSGTVLAEYLIPTSGSEPWDITSGPDGNLWFTEGAVHQIGKITPSGAFTEYPIPYSLSQPRGITSGPDGNLWFTDWGTNSIGKITPSGTVTEYTIPSGNGSWGITSGPNGNLWFTEPDGNAIGEITPGGAIAEFLLPTSDSGPEYITAGPDGNLWFTEPNKNTIGVITPGGTVLADYLIPTSNSTPYGITSGPDGNLWFTESSGNKIGEISTSGTFTEYPIPTSNEGPRRITSGPDGNLWFTEEGTTYQIGRVNLPGCSASLGKSASATNTLTTQSCSTPWGVDSGGTITQNFYTQVLNASFNPQHSVPAFWGRYIGSGCTGCNHQDMTLPEKATVHGLGLTIVPLFSDTGKGGLKVQTAAQAIKYAKAAIAAAQQLGIPSGIPIFVDIEPNATTTEAFIQAWFDQFKNSSYIAAYYGDSASSSKPETNFDSAYCAAVAKEAAIGTSSFLWAEHPSLTRTGQNNEPPYAPYIPPCANRTLVWQYAIQGKSGPPKVDTDEALTNLPLWHP